MWLVFLSVFQSVSWCGTADKSRKIDVGKMFHRAPVNIDIACGKLQTLILSWPVVGYAITRVSRI